MLERHRMIYPLLVFAAALGGCDDDDDQAADMAMEAPDEGPGPDMGPDAPDMAPDPEADMGPTVPVGLAEIMEPEVFTAEDGVLEATITVTYAENTLVMRDIDTGEITTRVINTRTYNGSIPGPTLKLGVGERLLVDMVNALPPNEDADAVIHEVNFPHHINSTNFHTHGLHVPPTGNGDNVLREIEPGHEALVDITIPDNHNPGMHWYHGHKHGANMTQFLSGMWGALIITGDLDEVPEVAAAAERILVFGDLGVDEDGVVPDPNPDAIGPGEVYIKDRIFTINGIHNPVLRIRPGEVQRWRLLNAATDCIMDLQIEGHQFHQLAADGITFDRMVSTDVNDIVSGQRSEFLVKGNSQPGVYRIWSPNSVCDLDEPSSARDIATLVVEGEPTDMALPDDLPQPDYIVPDTRGETPDAFETTQFSIAPPQDFLLQRTLIDGKSFDPSCTDKVFHRGDLVEWTLTNISPVAHPFHIHTNAFQVLEVNGEVLDPPIWRDVVIVPPTDNPANPGTVRIRTWIDDFIGGIVLHCHIITHEDLGMMQNVVIVDDTQERVTAEDIADLLSDPATVNPDVPGYYVSENFERCAPVPPPMMP